MKNPYSYMMEVDGKKKRLIPFENRIVIRCIWSIILYCYFVYLTNSTWGIGYIELIIGVLTVALLIDLVSNYRREKGLLLKCEIYKNDNLVKITHQKFNKEEVISIPYEGFDIELKQHWWGQFLFPNYSLIFKSNDKIMFKQKGNMVWDKNVVKSKYQEIMNFMNS